MNPLQTKGWQIGQKLGVKDLLNVLKYGLVHSATIAFWSDLQISFEK